jgi:hypothetical protein
LKAAPPTFRQANLKATGSDLQRLGFAYQIALVYTPAKSNHREQQT